MTPAAGSRDADAGPLGIRRADLPYPMVLAAGWSVCLLLIAAGGWLLGEVIGKLSLIVAPVAVAVLLAAMLRPLVDRIPARVPRAGAALVVVLGVLVFVLGALVAVAEQLATGIPAMREQISKGTDTLLRWLEEGPLHLTADRLQEAVDQTRHWVESNSASLAAGAVKFGHSAIEGIAALLICLVSLFFFLYHGEKLWEFVVRWVPRAGREHVDQAFRHGWVSLGAYTRTQLVVAAINAVGVGLGALVLRVPFVIPIVVVVFLASFVPIIGALAAGLLPTVLALVDRGLVIAIAMLVIVFVVHELETHILQPLLMGHAVALHPLAVILVVAAGTFLFGIVGALFAVPVTAMVNTVVRYLVGRNGEPGPGILPSDGEVSGPDGQDKDGDEYDDDERAHHADEPASNGHAPEN